MNSTAKGDAFEDRVHDTLKELIEKEEFIVPGKNWEIFKKRKYYSKLRESEIIVDIAIEVTRPGASQPAWYIIVECKDLGRKISVDDVEEFHYKFNQIKGANKKAYIFTTNSLQKSALKVAVNAEIGVVRVSTTASPQWIIERSLLKMKTSKSNVNFTKAMNALDNEVYYDQGDEILGFSDLTPVTSYDELFKEWNKIANGTDLDSQQGIK